MGKREVFTMRYTRWRLFAVPALTALVCAACGGAKPNPQAEAPPSAQVEREQDGGVVQVDHPEQFPLAVAAARTSTSQLSVTGVVAADVSRNVPVVSLASGRVVAIHARLGDTVQKGQPLLSIRSSDVAGAFSDYRKAVADETLAQTQLTRSQDLFAHGAISQSDLQIAEDTEAKAKVDVETALEHLHLLGNDPDKPNGTVEIAAPISGVITDQEVTDAASVQAFGPNPFTISDLTNVWVLCDVYENDLPAIRQGDGAEIRINAYPGEVLKGRIGNIGAILDPNLRSAKVRIEVHNPGILRLGMFATATFHGQKVETRTVVPAAAILHLRDRDWVYAPAGAGKFQRVEVVSGNTLPGNLQEIVSGLQPGAQVIANALVLENTVEQ
jgi:cobalt-zinc-cadmium efflux system membrane fusion protein